MSGDQIGGIVRAIIAAFSGYFVGKGYFDSDTVLALGGALGTLATIAWSLWSKTSAPKA